MLGRLDNFSSPIGSVEHALRRAIASAMPAYRILSDPGWGRTFPVPANVDDDGVVVDLIPSEGHPTGRVRFTPGGELDVSLGIDEGSVIGYGVRPSTRFVVDPLVLLAVLRYAVGVLEAFARQIAAGATGLPCQVAFLMMEVEGSALPLAGEWLEGRGDAIGFCEAQSAKTGWLSWDPVGGVPRVEIVATALVEVGAMFRASTGAMPVSTEKLAEDVRRRDAAEAPAQQSFAARYRS
jgi:hypothetical protein